MSIKRQTATGVFWLGVAAVVARGISALRTLFLAKLLLPSDFGLVAVAFLAINSLELFRELGFGSALVVWRKDLDEAADTANITILASSALLYLVALAAAEPLMWLISRDAESVAQAVPVLRVLALTMLTSAVGQVPGTLLAKEMNFRLKIVPQLVGALAGVVFSVALALMHFGVWSLVYGYLLETTLSSVVVWFVCSWRPKWRFSWPVAKEMFGYGKSIVGSQVLVFFITNIDNAFVSRLLGPTALGHYSFAYNTSNLPATQITRLVSQATFPAFSKVQDRLETLRDIYLKTTRYVSLVSVPVAICIIAFAPEFINDIYGATWAPTIVPLQLLGIYGLIRSVAANMGNIFKAGNKPHWLVGIGAFRLALMAAALYPATAYYGINGVAALSAVVSVIDFVISMLLVNRIVKISAGFFLRLLAPILLNSSVAAIAAKLCYPSLFALSSWFRKPALIALPAAGLIMVAVYGALTWWMDAETRALVRSAARAGWRRVQAWRGRRGAA